MIIGNLHLPAFEILAEKMKTRFDISCEVVTDKREAVKDADIICTLTPSNDPVLFGRDLKQGAHINAVGACSPQSRELDTEAVIKSRVFVDKTESALTESGDILIPISENEITEKHIEGEIGDLCIKKIEARRSEDDITLFKALGQAAEDLAAASFIYDSAIEKSMGGWIDL